MERAQDEPFTDASSRRNRWGVRSANMMRMCQRIFLYVCFVMMVLLIVAVTTIPSEYLDPVRIWVVNNILP